MAENHREAFAGRGTVAERLQRGGAMAELLAVSAMAKRMAAPWLRSIGKLLLARGTVAESHRENLLARALQRSTIGKQPLPER